MSGREFTAEQLRAAAQYNPETGVFTRKGRQITCVSKRGYVVMCIFGSVRSVHRLAWLYVTGSHATNSIDHINGIKTDNRFCNLRDVSASVNMQNRRAASINNSTGHLGVTMNGSGYRARIVAEGTMTCLGTFRTAVEASAVYQEAKRVHHAAAFAKATA